MIYPDAWEMSEYIPINIRRIYKQALRIKRTMPLCYAVLIRRALEEICIYHNAKGKDLHKKLSYLGREEIIPPTLSSSTKIIKNVGNIGAHVKKLRKALKEYGVCR